MWEGCREHDASMFTKDVSQTRVNIFCKTTIGRFGAYNPVADIESTKWNGQLF